MRPAFTNLWQAVGFFLLLLLIVLAPALAGEQFLPPRKAAYTGENTAWGPYPWIRRQIFAETNDIDIAFVGSSRMLCGIDTPYVQQKLDEQAGRKTVVRSICWAGASMDALYFISQDLMQHRHIKLLVFCDEFTRPYPNPEARYWFRFGDNGGDLAGLALRDKAVFYFASVLGMPRNLLEQLNHGVPGDGESSKPDYFATVYHAPDPGTKLGSVGGQVGFYDSKRRVFAPFVETDPPSGVSSSNVFLYGPATASYFHFLDQPLFTWQADFARKFARQARAHDIGLVLLHIPMFGEVRSEVISESVDWPVFLQMDVPMVGIPAGRMFGGLSDGEARRFYYNDEHLNRNGQKYFTTLVTPRLLQLYENQAKN